MKKLYKALVTEKGTGNREFIEFESKSKKSFIEEMNRNGYAVYHNIVEESGVYDWILDNTTADSENWGIYRERAKKALSK